MRVQSLYGRTANGCRSLRRRVGRTRVASCSSWPRSAGADRDRGGTPDRRAVQDRARDQRVFGRAALGGRETDEAGGGRTGGPGCVLSRRGSRARRRSARQSPMPSTTGPRSRGSWRTGGSACPTTRPSGRCAGSRRCIHCAPLSRCFAIGLIFWRGEHGPAVRRSRRSLVRRAGRGPDLVRSARHDLLGGRRMPSLMSRRMRWRVTPSVVAASDIVSHSPFFSAER